MIKLNNACIIYFTYHLTVLVYRPFWPFGWAVLVHGPFMYRPDETLRYSEWPSHFFTLHRFVPCKSSLLQSAFRVPHGDNQCVHLSFGPFAVLIKILYNLFMASCWLHSALILSYCVWQPHSTTFYSVLDAVQIDHAGTVVCKLHTKTPYSKMRWIFWYNFPVSLTLDDSENAYNWANWPTLWSMKMYAFYFL